MPKGDLSVIRLSDGAIIGSAIPTAKSAHRAIKQDLMERGHEKAEYVITPSSKIVTCHALEDGSLNVAASTSARHVVTNDPAPSDMMF